MRFHIVGTSGERDLSNLTVHLMGRDERSMGVHDRVAIVMQVDCFTSSKVITNIRAGAC